MGMVRLLSESEAIKADEATWTSLLGCCIVVLAPATSAGGAEEEAVEEVVGFDGDAYSQLHFAAKAVTDPLPEVGVGVCGSAPLLASSHNSPSTPPHPPPPPPPTTTQVPDAGTAVAQTLAALCQSAPGVYSARLARGGEQRRHHPEPAPPPCTTNRAALSPPSPHPTG